MSSPRVDISGVSVSNPDRLIFPGHQVTKRTLAEYYVRVAPRMLPHVIGRPLSLVRCPDGQGEACFYQKHWTTAVPPGVELIDIDEDGGKSAPYVGVRDVRGLVALVQYGVLEVHCWGAHVSTIEQPDLVVFDLDPAPEVPWTRVVATARSLRLLLKVCGLKSWLKTTGGKGLHVVLPIHPNISWGDLHDFARLATARLVERDPDGLVDVASKAARSNRIFVDYLRNARGATAVAPWSSRAREGGPVAVPISWAQLSKIHSASDVSVATADAWLRGHRTDPWRNMPQHSQQVTQEVMELLLTADFSV